MRVLARFMIAVSDARQFPAPDLPEIAFLGRSNVGKSSVINSLLGSKVAKTSSTPGRTRSINFFEVRWPGKPRPELVFTDLPGYGYAHVSRQVSQEWPKFIEPYLKERPSLALCLALIDVNVPPQASDGQLLKLSRWLTAAWGIILIVIAIVARNWGSVFTVGLTIASLVYGPMLGAFLLGVLTKRANQRGDYRLGGRRVASRRSTASLLRQNRRGTR